MGFFDKLERRLEGAINKAFTVFPGDVMPVQIANAMLKEMDANAKALSAERRLAPNDFTVRLAQRDYERLAPYSRTLNSQIIPTLREHAAERGYVFNGTLAITYLLDETLKAGSFSLECNVVAGVVDNMVPVAPDDANPSLRVQRAPLVLEVNGVRHPLVPPGFVIGRGSEADLRISDPNISRMHARIVVSDDPNPQIRIVDMGSANGITVNGEQVLETELGSGSRIEMGSTRMLVHAPIGE